MSEGVTVEMVGRYHRFEKIGAGGMGVVYRGFDPELHRPVALKRMHLDPHRVEPRAVRRLRREARAVARLNHPAVAQIYDVLEQDGVPWIVLELVDGRSIPALQKCRAVTWDERLGWLHQISEGLAAAHREGLLHRDLKHENVLVTEDGAVKILDFGLALDLQAPASSSEHGRLAGTGRVMSPEQVLGIELDARSDLFSFGVLIYETVAGESPFRAETLSATFQRILSHRPPSLHEIDPGTPPELSRLVDALLCKEKEQRPKRAEDVAARLLAMEKGGRWHEALDQSTLPPGDETLDRPASAADGAPEARRLPLRKLGKPRRARLLISVFALLLLGVASVVPNQEVDVMGADSPDVIAPDAFDALMQVRVRLESVRGLESLEQLEADLRRLEVEHPGLIELPLKRCVVLRRLYHATHDNSYLERAFGVAAKARALRPNAVEPLLAELAVALTLAQRQRAAQLIAEIDQRAPGRFENSALRAWSLRLRGEPERAIEILRLAASRHTTPEALYELALANVEAGDYAAARDQLGHVLELAPTFLSALALLAQAEMLGGDLERAAELFGRLLEHRQDVFSLTNLGVVELLRGRGERARALFADAVELAPANANLRLNLADGQAAAGDHAAAEASYAAVLELQDRSVPLDHWNYWTVRAQALSKLGRGQEALAAIDRARSLSDGPQMHLELAVVYAELGEGPSALEHLKVALCEHRISAVWLRLPVFERLRDELVSNRCPSDRAAPGSP